MLCQHSSCVALGEDFACGTHVWHLVGPLNLSTRCGHVHHSVSIARCCLASQASCGPASACRPAAGRGSIRLGVSGVAWLHARVLTGADGKVSEAEGGRPVFREVAGGMACQLVGVPAA